VSAARHAAGRRLLLVVADGVRPDVFTEELEAGHLPAVAALRERGGLYAVSSSFPSVTGPAYVPFLMGHHPATVGMPGLRWFDRARRLRWSPSQTRSYAGIDIWHADHDVSREAATLLELARPSLAGMSMLGRGASAGHIGRSTRWMVRASIPHFRGDLHGWRRVEQAATRAFLKRFARVRPRAAVLALTSPDKLSHKLGPASEAVRAAIRDVDVAIAEARTIADRDGWGESLHVWIVGDHGHASVSAHDDLHGWLEGRGLRVLAHPRLDRRRPDVALMVGGNAMAHLYLEPEHRTRRWWPALGARWTGLHDDLVGRDSIDLVSVAVDASRVRVTHASHGSADVVRHGSAADARWDYLADGGDPLRLGGTLRGLDEHAAWEASAGTPYPDAVVQLASLGLAARTGDLVVSAAEGWDLRARYEPVPHVSTHGALLRDQMMVPLLIDVPVTRVPQRTSDVMPSALDLLGIGVPPGMQGRSVVAQR
jgi:hypothetical protein